MRGNLWRWACLLLIASVTLAVAALNPERETLVLFAGAAVLMGVVEWSK